MEQIKIREGVSDDTTERVIVCGQCACRFNCKGRKATAENFDSNDCQEARAAIKKAFVKYTMDGACGVTVITIAPRRNSRAAIVDISPRHE